MNSKLRGRQQFLWFMVDGFYEKNMDKDESVTFRFYHVFGEIYMYIHRSHIFILFIDPRPNSTQFSTFSPLRDLEKH